IVAIGAMNMNSDEIKVAEESVTRMRNCCGALQTQMGSVLIGQSEVVRLLLTGLMAGGHMLVIGVPGLAKTMMVKALADLLEEVVAGKFDIEKAKKRSEATKKVEAFYRKAM